MKTIFDAKITPPARNRAPRQAPIEWSLYFAAGLGAFLIGFFDLAKNGNSASPTSGSVTVLRIADTLREHFYPMLGQGYIALMLLAALGASLCFVYRPTSRKEAFALGLSIFALTSATFPYKPPLNQTALAVASSPFAFIASAIAQSKDRNLWDYYFEFDIEGVGEQKRPVLATLRSASGALVLDQSVLVDDKIVRYQIPEGRYLLNIECEGCRRSTIIVIVDPKTQASRVTIGKSSWPLSLQRLVASPLRQVQDLSDEDARSLKTRFDAQSALADSDFSAVTVRRVPPDPSP